MGRTKGKHSENGEASGPNDPTLEIPVKNPPDKLDLILQEIKDSRQAIENRLGSITAELSILRDDQNRLSGRIQKTESNIAEILPTHTENRTAIELLQQQVQALQKRAEDAEGRSRRNNIHIQGIPEGKEGKNPTQYVEEWLKSIAEDRLSVHFVVERAHRIPSRKPPPGAPAHPLIARILNFRDRDTILQIARELDPIIVDSARISCYPDYTMIVQKRRTSFQGVKQRLRAEGITYAILFPARMRISYNQKTLFFETPDLVCAWLDETFPQSKTREPSDAPPQDNIINPTETSETDHKRRGEKLARHSNKHWKAKMTRYNQHIPYRRQTPHRVVWPRRWTAPWRRTQKGA
ncbi:hypothetical protein NDU88_005943 [Pleurodeles waltl]|uniref:L1 transposable element RRM domain-containing protein n=1 Tax=Pleurodeles waltl TaxID=8319 RepID=A0AAV7LVH7_PLEWA|nr:hypothetical protein NDU88_005943 [Pleurodeles waltl]